MVHSDTAHKHAMGLPEGASGGDRSRKGGDEVTLSQIVQICPPSLIWGHSFSDCACLDFLPSLSSSASYPFGPVALPRGAASLSVCCVFEKLQVSVVPHPTREARDGGELSKSQWEGGGGREAFDTTVFFVLAQGDEHETPV